MKGKIENSVIDFVIVCDTILPFVSEFLVDEDKVYALTNYSNKKKAIHSDHNSLITTLKLKIEKKKEDRVTVFNYKDEESWRKFKLQTSVKGKFTKIFSSSIPFEKKVRKWEKMLKRSIHSCFNRIRLTKKKITKKCNKFERRKKAIMNKNRKEYFHCL